jgi:hypothetical protein
MKVDPMEHLTEYLKASTMVKMKVDPMEHLTEYPMASMMV